jgi:NAD(P)-dependent dehydrogenase (short-subunit alcohol dehydrogenase family)
VREPAGTAVVVGASRGLGAALALALAWRGYEVHGVYASSSAAAGELRAVAESGGGRLVLHRADAGRPNALEELRAAVSSARPLRAIVLAAALPPLPTALAPDAIDMLADHVAASVRLAAAPLAVLLPHLADDGTIVVCSSSALDEPPRDWPHYVAAKGALEGLAAWTAAAYPRASTVVVRLPKLRTDMTNTPAGRIGAAPVEPVASWLADLVAGGTDAGLTTVEPPATPAARRHGAHT